MKNLYISITTLLLSASAFAQSFTTDGSRTIENLDASGSHYTFYNISTGKTVSFTDSATTNWDIAFRGTTILINGGTSGPGTVEAQVVPTDYAAVIEAPASGYVSDAATGKAIKTGSGNGWYNYDSQTNIISSLPNKTIAVKLSNGGFAKIQILSYYKDNNTTSLTKFYTFRISESTTSTLGSTITSVKNLRADGNHFQFFNLAQADTVSDADSASTKWDIAFRGTTIIVNSGTSGLGTDSAQVVLQSFDAINEAPTNGWKVDNASGKTIMTGSDNGWYSYNAETHVISAIFDRTILVKTSTGKYVKIKIKSYYKDANSANAAKYYSFVYEYQPDGTNALRATEANGTTDINDVTLSGKSLTVYPNPVASSGILKFTEEINLVKLFNAQGGEVLSVVPSSNELELGSLGVQSGFYTIQLTTANAVKTEKIIVQ